MVFSAEENDLTILSWNIKMLTAPYGWLHNRVERAENIVHTLNTAENYDVILFQEVFSGRIRKLMYKGLQSIYPYQLIPKDQSCIGKSNSGLWVYSVVQDEQKFHIINTHLQADYKTKYNKIRTQQYTEIYEKLILPNDKSEIPLILCGDLNISKPGKLKIMLEKLHLMNGPLSGDLQFSSTGENAELLDYILVKSDNFQFNSIERKIVNMSKIQQINPESLSDHYPIMGIFTW